MEQALTALGKDKIDGVYAANDGTAGGAIAAMKAAGVNPCRPSPARTPSWPAIQRILAGEQYMTVYKAIKPEAETAAQLAVAWLQRQAAPARRGQRQGRTTAQIDVPVDPAHAGRGDQGQRQEHGHQGRLLEARRRSAPAATRSACTAARHLVGEPMDAPRHDRATRPLAASCEGVSKRFGAVQALDRRRLRGRTPARSSPWSATTAPASRP